MGRADLHEKQWLERDPEPDKAREPDPALLHARYKTRTQSRTRLFHRSRSRLWYRPAQNHPRRKLRQRTRRRDHWKETPWNNQRPPGARKTVLVHPAIVSGCDPAIEIQRSQPD